MDKSSRSKTQQGEEDEEDGEDEDEEEEEESVGGGRASKKGPRWLRDYRRGMEYEVYSLVLSVAKDSCLWGLTFRRWVARV